MSVAGTTFPSLLICIIYTAQSHWVPPIGGLFYLCIFILNNCMRRGSRTTPFGIFYFIFFNVTVWEAFSVWHKARE